MTPLEADGSAPLSKATTLPTEAARQKTRDFLGDESAWKKVRLRLWMAGPPGYPGSFILLTGGGRLRHGKTDLPPLDSARVKEIFNLFIEEGFTGIDVGNEPGIPGSVVISLEMSVGLCRRHRVQCFANATPSRLRRLVDAMLGLVRGP